MVKAFQSTLSMRRATQTADKVDEHLNISIHALHEESDQWSFGRRLQVLFQSTLSMRRATLRLSPVARRRVISIHALHEESDPAVAVFDHVAPVISIHALHEESDPGAWLSRHLRDISIHALHEESDWATAYTPYRPQTFQSTLSMRRANGGVQSAVGCGDFNPRSP